MCVVLSEMLISENANHLSESMVVTFFVNFIAYFPCTVIVFRNVNGLFTVQEASLAFEVFRIHVLWGHTSNYLSPLRSGGLKAIAYAFPFQEFQAAYFQGCSHKYAMYL